MPDWATRAYAVAKEGAGPNTAPTPDRHRN